MAPDLSVFIANGRILAPYLCGYLNTGILATTSKILDSQNGSRTWNDRKIHVPDEYKCDTNLILPAGIPHLVAYTDFISRMDEARLEAVCKICPEEKEKLKEFYAKFQASFDGGCCHVSKLFKSDKSALSWQMIPEYGCGTRLMVDAAKIVSANLELFGCSHKKNATRHVKMVLTSKELERRWGALGLALERRKQNCPPPKIVDGTKLDFLGFHLFLRCCKGPASDLTTVEDAVRGAFIGLGDLREASKILEEISKSEATTEEQASYGVDGKTQADSLEALRAQVASIVEDFSEVKTKVETMDTTVETMGTVVETIGTTVDTMGTTVETMGTTVETMGTAVETLRTNIIPSPNRIYVCGYMDKHFAYESTALPRLEVLRLFGGLVSKLLGDKGLRETIGKEETTTASGQWKQRNVYDDRIHLEAFGECFKTLPLHLPGELAKFRREEEYRFKRSVRDLYNEMLTGVNKDELFKDVGDTKLRDAGEDREKRERVFIDREQSLWFTFRKEYEVLQRSSSDGGSAAAAAFKSAVALYTKRRMEKKNKEDEKKKRKEEAKASAQPKKRAKKTTTL